MTCCVRPHPPRAERLAHVAIDVDADDAHIRSTAAIVTMPSKKAPRRRFSFSSCWLLSKFTIGTSSAGKPSASMKGAIGTRAAERAQLHRRLAERPRHRRDERARVRIRRRRAERVRCIGPVSVKPRQLPVLRARRIVGIGCPRGGSPASRYAPAASRRDPRAGVSFTRRMSIAAVARSGTMVRAPAPTNELASPRMLSVGYCIASCSFGNAFSGAATPNVSQHPRGVVGHGVQHRALLRGQRRHGVVVAGDRHAPVVILHRREQRREPQRRVRHPVAVVAAVHAALRSEDGEVDAWRCRARRRRRVGRPLECAGPSRITIRSARSLSL